MQACSALVCGLCGVFAITVLLGSSAAADDKWQQLIDSAQKALRDEQYAEAVRLASEFIAAHPDEGAGYAVRAAAYTVDGKPAEAVKDIDRLISLSPARAPFFEWRGNEKFKLKQFKEAIADFDQECKLEPAREPWHWKRGLAYYYAGQYEKGRDQFQRYHDREDNDVENAVWRVMCMARIKEVGLKKAQDEILVVRRDSRVPMMEVYALFAGKGKPEEVLAAIEQGTPGKPERNGRMFYGHLYLGLHADMTGDKKEAIRHLKIAVEHPIKHFMWDIARIHLSLLIKNSDDEPRTTKHE